MKTVDLIEKSKRVLEEFERMATEHDALIEDSPEIEGVPIEDSPFLAVWNEEEQSYMIVLGNEVMINPEYLPFDSVDEVKAWIDTKHWDLIIRAVAVFTKKFNELQKLQKK
jgi:hypothetical protein